MVTAACIFLVVRFQEPGRLRTDLTALLPLELQDPARQKATDLISRSLAQRFVVLVSHKDAAQARARAAELAKTLEDTGLVGQVGEEFSTDRIKQLGALYFPYRSGLMSSADRTALLAGRGQDLAERALATIAAPGAIADARLLKADPFLLLPSFLFSLPFPATRLALEDGLLTRRDEAGTHVLLPARLLGSPFDLSVQKSLVSALDRYQASLAEPERPVIRRLGAVFFAEAGGRKAIDESTWLAALALSATILLILIAFRGLRPLLYNLLVIGAGVACGLAACLFVFGQVHVAVLLFGIGLVGIAADYGFYYMATGFLPGWTPAQRIREILSSLSMALLIAVLGYGALALAPFPGLRQIAVFSAVGLVSSYLTTVIWLPLLSTGSRPAHASRTLQFVMLLSRLWTERRWRALRVAFCGGLAFVMLAGFGRISFDDDVRKLQPLDAALAAQQNMIAAITGLNLSTQYLLIEAESDEYAQQIQEQIAPLLEEWQRAGLIKTAQSPAAYVPSQARQEENRTLRREKLTEPHLAELVEALGLQPSELAPATTDNLPIATALAGRAIPFLNELVLAPGLHVVTLQGVADPERIKREVAAIGGVKFADPTADLSSLLGLYRVRALSLLGLSLTIIFALATWRYGFRGAVRALVPSLTALVVVPCALSLIGQPLTFFTAMALVLLLSFTMDYSVFFAEGKADNRAVTFLAVGLAALATVFSFGVLGLSDTPAVANFGFTILIGVVIAGLLAPVAARPDNPR
ncbi:hypothetical protein FQV39_22955 [Bosea sp. F3-2]|uniref:MMPL family transporter n=1 Tax=Bosea sp. F3-2 TaxID=2599640 RepID=UPI0011EF8886|nr:hypothetical protein [Bosea sp. F3-2]QEL25134.1 hypothetical protein FQV39_22955 [Bosea sp. F3-2]